MLLRCVFDAVHGHECLTLDMFTVYRCWVCQFLALCRMV